MIHEVYEVDQLIFLQLSRKMKDIAFVTDFRSVDSIINHLKLNFFVERPLKAWLPSPARLTISPPSTPFQRKIRSRPTWFISKF